MAANRVYDTVIRHPPLQGDIEVAIAQCLGRMKINFCIGGAILLLAILPLVATKQMSKEMKRLATGNQKTKVTNQIQCKVLGASKVAQSRSCTIHGSEQSELSEQTRTIPIVVIVRNAVTFLRRFINQIKRLIYNIIVIDNLSKYPPLLEYYETLKCELGQRLTIHSMAHNVGHEVSDRCRVHLRLPEVFLLSDPDLELNPQMPRNFAAILYQLSNKHRCFKVGSALDISEPHKFIPVISQNTSVTTWEEHFWYKRIPHKTFEIYDASVDTTFTLVNYRFRQKHNLDGATRRPAIRIAGSFTAKHLPWYNGFLKKNIPQEELQWLYNASDGPFRKVFFHDFSRTAATTTTSFTNFTAPATKKIPI